MKSLSVILASFFDKLGEVMGSIWGCILTCLLAIVNFFVDYRLAFLGVIICIVFDAIAGIWSAIKQGKYARSELMRDTFSKIFAYGGAMVVCVFIEQICEIENTIGTNIVGSLICATELWSMMGNMLIVNPNLYFFRIFRNALIGEIARKLGREESEVQEAFDKNEKLTEKE